MQIILISKIKNLGDIGDVVKVKNGYAKNYLFPQKKAINYSKINYEAFEEQKQKLQEENKKKKEQALINQEKINKKDVIIIENAGDDGRLYGSVSNIRLASYVNEITKENLVKKSNIVVYVPIKNIGKYKVSFELHSEVVFDKEIIVARTQEEAKKIKSGEWEKELEKKKEEEEARLKVETKVIDKKNKEKKKEEKKSEEDKKIEKVEEKVEEKKSVKKVKEKKEVEKKEKK